MQWQVVWGLPPSLLPDPGVGDQYLRQSGNGTLPIPRKGCACRQRLLTGLDQSNSAPRALTSAHHMSCRGLYVRLQKWRLAIFRLLIAYLQLGETPSAASRNY